MFEVGDVVAYLGVNGKPGDCGLAVGSIHRVRWKGYHPFYGYMGIRIDAMPEPVQIKNFQKLPPADPAFITLIRSLKPGRVREDA